MGEIRLLFHYPKLSALDLGVVRSPGPGLGNLLFPITRALIGEKTLGGTFVHPTIRQFKVGTYLRGEKDKRTYGDVIRPRSRDEWSTWIQAIRSPKLEEGARPPAGRTTICYSGLRRQFHDIWQHGGLIADWLNRNAVRADAPAAPYDIALHVRQGDFRAVSTSGRGRSIRQPPDWYRQAVDVASELLQTRRAQIRLFTDGDVRQVAGELALEGLTFDESPNALVAIKNMTQARIIVTSRSSFSMWAAFLSGAPAIWDKKMDLSEVFPPRNGLDHFL
jgi:hypothetical protein